jgi:hypothetical protein
LITSTGRDELWAVGSCVLVSSAESGKGSIQGSCKMAFVMGSGSYPSGVGDVKRWI